jgi:hypothetical protein
MDAAVRRIGSRPDLARLQKFLTDYPKRNILSRNKATVPFGRDLVVTCDRELYMVNSIERMFMVYPAFTGRDVAAVYL